MDNIDHLISRIEKKASEEISGIERSFSEKLRGLESDFQDRKDHYMEEKRTESERIARLRKKEIITLRKLDIKKDIVNKKRRALDMIFDKAIEMMRKLPEKRYGKLMEIVLRQVVVESDESISPSKGNRVFTGDFIKKINKKYGWNLKKAPETDRVADGFVLVGADCETVVDWTGIREYLVHEKEDSVVRELFA